MKAAETLAASLAPQIASPEKSPRESGRSPRPGGAARGTVPDVGGRTLPYAKLKSGGDRAEGLDTDNLEAYLAPGEFEKVLGLSREKFYQLPSWRRQQIKKEKGLC